MPCKMCRERGKTWIGDDPQCAFETGVFSPDNWNCATMNALRERSEELGTDFRDDMAAASIGYVPFESEDGAGYVVMTWYKDRGRTGQAIVMWDDEPPRPLTESDALAALEYSKRFLPRSRDEGGGKPSTDLKLTPAQQRVYDAIARLESELGHAPSIREIAQAAGLTSPSTVHMHLRHLLEAGLIRRATNKQGYVIERGRTA